MANFKQIRCALLNFKSIKWCTFLILKVTSKNVIPAKTGIHKFLTLLDSRWSLPLTCYGAGVTNWELLEVPLNEISDFYVDFFTILRYTKSFA